MKIQKITKANYFKFITPNLRATRATIDAANRVKKECESNGLKCTIKAVSDDGDIRYYIYAR